MSELKAPVKKSHKSKLTTPAKQTLWEDLDEIWAAVPDEELRKLPADLASQHDHYLYGLSKKPR